VTTNTYHSAPSGPSVAPSGCPVRSDWSPLALDYLTDPYPIARQLSDDTPVFFDEQLGCVVVTRREDIDAVFADHETYASTNVQDPIAPLCPAAAKVLGAVDFNPVAVMSNRPEPDHGRIRVHTGAGFSNRRLATIEPFIRRRCEELVDAFLMSGTSVEFVSALAFPLPGETVFRFIGFPESDDERLKAWCLDRKTFSWGRPSPDDQVDIAQGMLGYWRYCREFTAARRDAPLDDFASELLAVHLADPDELSYREVESIIYGLSFAGHEAVTALLCNSLRCVLSDREQWAALVSDRSTIPNAVEEVLRFESSQISWRRITTRSTQIGGVDLPAGIPLFLNFASANRQPDIFDDPDRFDIGRSNARSHISFGKGVHYCLGAKLARLEARIVLESLASNVPSLRLTEPQELTWSPNITFRGPQTLEIEWDTPEVSP